MIIKYKNNKIMKICTDLSYCKKNYSDKIGYKLFEALKNIKSFNNVEELIKFKICRCHKLLGDRKGQYAMDLIHPFRLVFTIDSNLNIQIAEIIEIVDYH